MGVLYYHIALDNRRVNRLNACKTSYKRFYMLWSSIKHSPVEWKVDSDKSAPFINDALISDPFLNEETKKLRTGMFYGAKPLLNLPAYANIPNIRYIDSYAQIIEAASGVSQDLFRDYQARRRSEKRFCPQWTYLWHNFERIRSLFQQALIKELPAIVFAFDDLELPLIGDRNAL